MADYKNIPQEKIGLGSKVLVSPVITPTDGKVKPLRGSATGEGFVTKTETFVENIPVPMATMQGKNPSPIITPVVTTLSPSPHQPIKGDDYISKVQTEATRPYKTGPLSNLYWWCKPNSNGNGRSNGTGITKYNKPTDAGMSQQYFDRKQEPTVSNILGKEAPPKAIPLTKPTNIMGSAIDHLDGAVPQIQGHVLPHVVSSAEISQPAIDSREAARRYGGLSTSPVVAYAPAIDSRDAAWKYRGQMLSNQPSDF